MANSRAIAAVSATLLGLLSDAIRATIRPSLDFELYQPKQFRRADAEGSSHLPLAYRAEHQPPQFRHSHRPFWPPIPWLHSDRPLLSNRAFRRAGGAPTAAARLGDPGDARARSDGAPHLNHYLAESDIFPETESLDAIREALSVADYLTLWDRLKRLPPAHNLRASHAAARFRDTARRISAGRRTQTSISGPPNDQAPTPIPYPRADHPPGAVRDRLLGFRRPGTPIADGLSVSSPWPAGRHRRQS